LGLDAWGIQSELYYWNNRPFYDANINVGVNYYETLERLNNILPFLTMLPNAITLLFLPPKEAKSFKFFTVNYFKK
jgi:hypothetical protein